MSADVGSAAPQSEVELTAYVRGAAGPRRLTLSEFRGRWLALFFYARDFSPVGAAELGALAVLGRQLGAEGAAVVASSTDSYERHRAWYEGDPGLGAVAFPVVADAAGALAGAFDVLLADGTPLRGTFLVDPRGVVRLAQVNLLDVGPDVLETLRALRVHDRRTRARGMEAAVAAARQRIARVG